MSPLARSDVTLSRIAEDVVAGIRRRGGSPGYVMAFGSVARKIAARLPGPVMDLTAQMAEEYLHGIPGAARTRNNHLDTLRMLLRFARRRGLVPPAFDPLAGVLPCIEAGRDVTIYTPAEGAAVLRELMLRRPQAVPVLALVGWAGVRVAEALRMEWRELDFAAGRGLVRAAKAKTRARRFVALPAWLEAHREREGPLWPGCSRTWFEALHAASAAAGVPSLRNGWRHSFISYRVAVVESAARVALEAGTSEGVIFRNYRDAAPGEVAREWFRIEPLPLDLAA